MNEFPKGFEILGRKKTTTSLDIHQCQVSSNQKTIKLNAKISKVENTVFAVKDDILYFYFTDEPFTGSLCFNKTKTGVGSVTSAKIKEVCVNLKYLPGFYKIEPVDMSADIRGYMIVKKIIKKNRPYKGTRKLKSNDLSPDNQEIETEKIKEISIPKVKDNTAPSKPIIVKKGEPGVNVSNKLDCKKVIASQIVMRGGMDTFKTIGSLIELAPKNNKVHAIEAAKELVDEHPHFYCKDGDILPKKEE